MRWPRLTRRRAHGSAQPEATSAYRPGSWGQSSLPPVDVDPGSPSTGNVEVVPAPSSPSTRPSPRPTVDVGGPRPVVVSPAPAPAVEPVEVHGAGADVRLGFEDGSDLRLDPNHPHSLALKAVADLLLHKGPNRRAG